MNRWIPLLLAASITAARAGDVDPATLLARVQSKVRDNASRIPRYVCLQKIDREAFVRTNTPLPNCGTLPEQGLRNALGLTLVSSDGAHLDVMLAEGSELFSWPGGHSFDTASPNDLLGGGFSGSGDFANFVISVFGIDRVAFDYVGACDGVSCVRYQYDVPREVSHYVIRTALNQATVGYHGTFDVDPRSADLIQMTVVPTGLTSALSSACDIRTRMTYTQTKMAAGEFTIPVTTEKEYLSRDGSYFVNRVSYEGCRQYTTESVLTFEDEVPGIPSPSQEKVAALPAPGSELQLRLASKIDSELGSAGDVFEGTLVRAVRDTEGGTVPAGTVFRGHLALLEKAYSPRHQVVIAIRLETIVLHGSPVPVTLEPMGTTDSHGRAIFSFPGQKLVLDKQFVSRWRVRSPAP